METIEYQTNPMLSIAPSKRDTREEHRSALYCMILWACGLGLVFVIDHFAASHDSYLDEFTILTVVLVICSGALVYSTVRWWNTR